MGGLLWKNSFVTQKNINPIINLKLKCTLWQFSQQILASYYNFHIINLFQIVDDMNIFQRIDF